MKIGVLAEDTARSPAYGCEHGLSLYIESGRHKLLFDMGQTGLFLQNARKIGVDVGAVDAAFVSHGHYDHGGGLATFLEENDHSKVYVNVRVFEPHYSVRAGGKIAEIGVSAALAENPRIVKTGTLFRPDDAITIFSGVDAKTLRPSANRTLLMEGPEGRIPDDFSHEQNLIIEENGSDVLFTGCAHSGIINILEKAIELRGRAPRAVIGGFHLMLKEDVQGDANYATCVAQALGRYDCQYYTGHCTGEGGVRLLAKMHGSRVNRLTAGLIFNLGL